jgi:hypothetical protein
VHFEIYHKDEATNKLVPLDPETILRAGVGGLPLALAAAAAVYWYMRLRG